MIGKEGNTSYGSLAKMVNVKGQPQAYEKQKEVLCD